MSCKICLVAAMSGERSTEYVFYAVLLLDNQIKGDKISGSFLSILSFFFP